jgi:hypothetical protein
MDNCVDPVTDLVELTRAQNKTAAHVGMIFENNWLSGHPRLMRCVHDNGGEFTGADFQRTLELNGVKEAPTAMKNPRCFYFLRRDFEQSLGRIAQHPVL